jgi:hypothetical protein
MNELETKRAAVAARKHELAAATQAVQPEQKQVDAGLHRMREYESRLDAARDRPSYDAAEIALVSARKDQALALKRLHDRIDERVHAEAQLHAAERALAAQVDQIFVNEDIEEARQVAHLLDSAARRGKQLLLATKAGELNGKAPLPQVTQVLDRLTAPLPLVDAHDIGSNFLREGDTAATARRAARRAALIAGEEPAPREAAAA